MVRSLQMILPLKIFSQVRLSEDRELNKMELRSKMLIGIKTYDIWGKEKFIFRTLVPFMDSRDCNVKSETLIKCNTINRNRSVKYRS